MRKYIVKIYKFSNTQNKIYKNKGWLFLVLVNKDEFKEMVERGFINSDDYATTMKKHSKSKRHKHYCREDKYEKYIRWKQKQQNKQQRMT